MVEREHVLDYLKSKKPEFNRDFSITKLGLFGSYARNEQTGDSDIDLLVEFALGTEALSEKKRKIKKAVQVEFQREVDLCREKYIKPYFSQQILNSVIYI